MVDSERILIKWKETIRLETMMLVGQITRLLEGMDVRRLRIVLAYVQRLYSTS